MCTPGVVGPVITDCGYPYQSDNPLTNVVFSETEVLRAIDPSGGVPLASVRLFYNDEHALTLGVKHVDVITQGGDFAQGPTQPTVVAGPLCESGDVFTQEEGGVVVPRDLPDAAVGDLVVIRDAGAYASAMASNYNTRPLAPEFLLERGAVRRIRRRQTIEELLALED